MKKLFIAVALVVFGISCFSVEITPIISYMPNKTLKANIGETVESSFKSSESYAISLEASQNFLNIFELGGGITYNFPFKTKEDGFMSFSEYKTYGNSIPIYALARYRFNLIALNPYLVVKVGINGMMIDSIYRNYLGNTLSTKIEPGTYVGIGVGGEALSFQGEILYNYSTYGITETINNISKDYNYSLESISASLGYRFSI